MTTLDNKPVISAVRPSNGQGGQSPGLIICSHINLNRKPEANSDVCLMAQYLMNNYHINENGVSLGLEAFAPDFNYNYRDRDSSIERSPAADVVNTSSVPNNNHTSSVSKTSEAAFQTSKA